MVVEMLGLIKMTLQIGLSVAATCYISQKVFEVSKRQVIKFFIAILIIRLIIGILAYSEFWNELQNTIWLNIYLIVATIVVFLTAIVLLKIYSKESYIKAFIVIMVSDCSVTIFSYLPALIFLELGNAQWKNLFLGATNSATLLLFLAQCGMTTIGLKMLNGVFEYLRGKTLVDNWKGYLLIIIWNAASIILNHINFENAMITMSIVTGIVCIILGVCIGGQIREEHMRDLEEQFKQRKMIALYYETLQQQVTMIEELQNEVDTGVIELKESSPLKKGSSINEKIDGSVTNPLLQAVFSNKIEECSDIEIDICWKIGAIQMEDIEIVALFANIFDNAIEACRESRVERPRIKVVGNEQIGKMEILVENSIGDSKEVAKLIEKGLSKKRKGKRPGYGISIVDEIVEKYGGKVERNIEKDCFQTILQIHQGRTAV